MLQVSEMFSAKVPRYTSYPTAPHFHAGIDETIYRDWLKDIPRQVPLSLYVLRHFVLVLRLPHHRGEWL
jgi:coproporphyrinogen III oxidase-like Fe-S oxidoreductase